MCGINVIIDKTKLVSEGAILRMNESLSHRGPDANGFVKLEYNDQHIFLGHTRLSIIDADNTDSNQPICSQNKRYWLVYNGEIYNFKELKLDLENKGAHFITESDTEVLLEGLALYGSSFLDKVNGMYAFVLWDTVLKEVSFGRDPSGMKPLYRFDNEKYTIYSSSINSIQNSGLVELTLNMSIVEPYLRYKFATVPTTFFNEISALSLNKTKPETYRLCKDRQPTHFSENEILDQSDKILWQSIERHLISDKPVGLFLSGGVDSTLILSILQELGKEKVPVFTITNNPRDLKHGTEDFKYAKLAAQQYGAEYHTLEISDEILQEFDQMVLAMDEPIADPAALLTFVLSREARKSVSVVLSGAGADEVFGGYNRHYAFNKYLENRNLLPSQLSSKISSIIGFLLKAQISKQAISLLSIENRVVHTKKYFSNITSDPSTTFRNFTQLDFFPPLSRNGALARKTNEQYLNEAFRADRTDFLSQDVLAITDQMSMAHSLEVRLPYLDKELLEFVDNIPAKDLLQNGRKWILNQLLLKRNGDPFVNRRKEGFGMPLGTWLRKSKNKFILDMLYNPTHSVFQWISFDRTKFIVDQHLSGSEDFSREIWAVAVLSKWIDLRC